MIINSTVLIALDLIKKLDLIEAGLIPKRVYTEIQSESVKLILIEPKFKIITPTKKSRRRALQILGDIDETGDSDIIALLLDYPHSIIATDDKRLRSACRVLGGKITGTLGILIHSTRVGKITKDQTLDLLICLENTGFRMSITLYNKVKEKLNEIP
jgi:predicted nucleic acid-binding protein